MLAANLSSAERIYAEFPDCAMLRRHPAPPPSNFDPLVKAARQQGFTINVDSGKQLADSLNLATDPARPYFNTMLRMIATRCMMQVRSTRTKSTKRYFLLIFLLFHADFPTHFLGCVLRQRHDRGAAVHPLRPGLPHLHPLHFAHQALRRRHRPPAVQVREEDVLKPVCQVYRRAAHIVMQK